MRRLWRTPQAFSFPACGNARGSIPFTAIGCRFQSSSSDDLYATLGVRQGATHEEVKAAYKKLALEYHPDRNSTPGAEEKFKKVSEAYSVLGNRDKRKEYDTMRSFGGGRGGFPGGQGGFGNGGFGGGRGQQQAHPGFGGERSAHVSREEADRIFREMFGGANVNQMFRQMEEQMRQQSMRGGPQSMGGNPFGGGGFPGGAAGAAGNSGGFAFRPFFRSQETRTYTNEKGHTVTEQVFTTPDGRQHRVFTNTNQAGETFSGSAPGEAADWEHGQKVGNTKYGDPRDDPRFKESHNLFGQNIHSVRTNPMFATLSFLFLMGIALSLIGIFFGFLVSHPVLFFCVLGYFFFRRARW